MDDDVEVVEDADRFLREIRLAQGRAELTTKAYAESPEVDARQCRAVPDSGAQAAAKLVRGDTPINKVLTAVRMFLVHAVINKAVSASVVEQV